MAGLAFCVGFRVGSDSVLDWIRSTRAAARSRVEAAAAFLTQDIAAQVSCVREEVVGRGSLKEICLMRGITRGIQQVIKVESTFWSKSFRGRRKRGRGMGGFYTQLSR